MKFSILVPVYNVEKYLEQCVESLLNQTYKGKYEIILVDDGSTDSSGMICDRYQKNNPDKIKVVHKKNGGHTSARLEAIKNATGEYSLFCDSDDFVETELLETVETVLNNNPDTDMVMYSFFYYEDGSKKARNISVWEDIEIFENDNKQKLYDLILTTPYINSLWTKVIKTEFLKNDPVDYKILKDKDIAEDAYIVTYFITDCKKIININIPLYNYRINQQGISRAFDASKFERKNTLFLYYHLKSCLIKWNTDTPEYVRKLNARWLNEVIYMFSTYYESVTSAERKALLDYNWSSMLPEDVRNNKNNPYENELSRKLYNFILNKNHFRLKLYFTHKHLYKKYRKLKSRLLNK